MGKLSTHVLDTSRGLPGAGIAMDLMRCEGEGRIPVQSAVTDADGRTGRPLLTGDEMRVGVYELVFHAGDYFRGLNLPLTNPPFLDDIVIRFGISNVDGNYHVPLLLSPYGYSTYRGS